MSSAETVTIRGEEELAFRAGHLFTGPRSEFLCAATDMNTWSHPQARTALVRPTSVNGRLVRKLYTPSALRAEEQRLHLLDVAAKGVRVRICTAALPHETIIIDRRAMILAGPTTHGDREFTVTTARTLIDGVHALFEAGWKTAVELGDYLRQDVPQLDTDSTAILRTLGSGLPDEAAARRLGISLRTYRRRVAEIMTALEARSRFQAGLRAGELGLIH